MLSGSQIGGGVVGGVGSGIGQVITAPRRLVVGATAKFAKLKCGSIIIPQGIFLRIMLHYDIISYPCVNWNKILIEIKS